MPRLSLSFREFLKILGANGFVLHANSSGSHKRYRGTVDGKVQLVVVAFHNINDDIKPGTLDAMIRQSGLPKSKFRK